MMERGHGMSNLSSTKSKIQNKADQSLDLELDLIVPFLGFIFNFFTSAHLGVPGPVRAIAVQRSPVVALPCGAGEGHEGGIMVSHEGHVLEPVHSGLVTSSL